MKDPWHALQFGGRPAVELRLGEKRAGQLQDLVSPALLLDHPSGLLVNLITRSTSVVQRQAYLVPW
jgi:hypothetical protein